MNMTTTKQNHYTPASSASSMSEGRGPGATTGRGHGAMGPGGRPIGGTVYDPSGGGDTHRGLGFSSFSRERRSDPGPGSYAYLRDVDPWCSPVIPLCGVGPLVPPPSSLPGVSVGPPGRGRGRGGLGRGPTRTPAPAAPPSSAAHCRKRRST